MINSMPEPTGPEIMGAMLRRTGWTGREIGSTTNWTGREIGSMIDSMPGPTRPEIMGAMLWPSDYTEREIGSTTNWTGREIGSMTDSIPKPIGSEVINAMLWPSDYTEREARPMTVLMLGGTTSDETGSVVETTKANSASQVLETPRGFIEVKGTPKVPEDWRVDKIIKLAGPIPGPLGPDINTGKWLWKNF